MATPPSYALLGTIPPGPGSGRLCAASLDGPLPGRPPGSSKSGFEFRSISFRCDGGGTGRLLFIGAPNPPGPIAGFHLGLTPL